MEQATALFMVAAVSGLSKAGAREARSHEEEELRRRWALELRRKPTTVLRMRAVSDTGARRVVVGFAAGNPE